MIYFLIYFQKNDPDISNVRFHFVLIDLVCTYFDDRGFEPRSGKTKDY